MSLTAAAKLVNNAGMREKVAASIRNASAAKFDAQGNPGRLARVCLMDPSIALDHFMMRIASNPTITNFACSACGHVDKTADGEVDVAIDYVVETTWADIADIIYSGQMI